MRHLQKAVAGWVSATFGKSVQDSRRERAMRVCEEGIELAQSEGLGFDVIQRLAVRVYDRPKGEPTQEGAGVGVTLFAWADAAGLDLRTIVLDELARVSDPEVQVKCREKAKEKARFNLGMLPDLGEP